MIAGVKAYSGTTALALSGGGFRATLFHLGTLVRLNELGMLQNLKCISGISGGSIITAWLGLNWGVLEFDDSGAAINLDQVITVPILKFTRRDIDLIPSLSNIALMLFGLTTSALSGQYKKYLFHDVTLADLPDPSGAPEIVIGASNLQTGSFVSFTRNRLSDPRLGFIDDPKITIADTVASSSAYPPFLSPVILKIDPSLWKSTGESDLHSNTKLKSRMVLTDGGIHDPSASAPLVGSYDLVYVSDCSITREPWLSASSFWIRQTGRSTLMQTISNSEARRDVLDKIRKKTGADPGVIWWANSDRLSNYNTTCLTSDSDITRSFSTMRTRLNGFNEKEQKQLINWGYILADAAIRSNIELSSPPEPSWPYPGHKF